MGFFLVQVIRVGFPAGRSTSCICFAWDVSSAQFEGWNDEISWVGVSAWSVTVRRMHSDEGIARLVAAVRELDPKPRERRWVSVSFCVLDAVYSIGAHYDNHVVPVVRRVAADFDMESPSMEMSVPEAADPVPLDAVLDRYTSVEALVETTKNRQNTSTCGGIRKADAVRRYAEVLREHGVLTLDDARRLLTDTVRLDAAESALRKVPGEGGAGVRRGYLWMLIGHQDTVKPNRMGCDGSLATERKQHRIPLACSSVTSLRC
ncbi:hypothetical protein B0E55_05838 [Rhodococcus sp. 66b]|nr:hypothetical protein B0E55_05838 [Rhodococcus sp. 66b]